MGKGKIVQERIYQMLSSLTPERAKKGKIASAEEAVCVIIDGETVATVCFVGTGFAKKIPIRLEEYFLETGKPRNLKLLCSALRGKGRNRIKALQLWI